MVISYMRRFLFVHVYKAAGMSIEKALKSYDVRAGLLGHPMAEQERLLQALGFNPAILGMQRHVSAAEVRDAIGGDLFGKLFRFAFVRNPWDLQLSLYHFNLAHPEFAPRKPAATFEEHIHGLDPTQHPIGQQRRFLIDGDGKMLVDYVGRFETLAEDFAEICGRLGLDKLTLEHVNRTAHKPWTESYSPRMFEIVRTIHRPDIEAFGYEGDPAAYGVG
jgi:hypothetical protein